MITRIHKLNAVAVLAAAALFVTVTSAQADILGPYTPDGNTVHLWHLDTPVLTDGVPSPPTTPDSAGSLHLSKSQRGDLGVAAGAFGYVGDSSFHAYYGDGGDHPHLVGFTNAAGLLGGTGTGAWTIEGLVNLDNLATGVIARTNGNEIRVYLENPQNSSRNLLVDVGFDGALTPNRNFAIPDAIVTGQWYHWAITYNGNEGAANNVEAFWTPLDNSYTAAQSLGTRSSAVDPTLDRFVINSQSGGNLIGHFDEVRISNIVRTADDMMFGVQSEPVPEPSTYALALVGMAGLGLIAWRRRRRG